MKRTFALIIICCLLFCTAAISGKSAVADAYDWEVRVRLSTGSITTTTVQVTGTYSVNGTSFTNGTLTASLSGSNVKLTHSSKGTLATGNFIRVVRQDADKDSAYLEVTMSNGQVRTYLGDLVFHNESGTILRVTNYIGMHEYLYGAVSGEVSESSDYEILKTQTIAAKCFALVEVASSSGQTFDVYDTTTSQLYIGYVATDVRTIAAVDEVYTQTLLYNGNVVKTHYGTRNGGMILTPMMRWGGTTSYEGAYLLRYDAFDVLTNSNNKVYRINGAEPASTPSELYGELLDAASEAISGTATSIVSVESMSGAFVYAKKNSDSPTELTAELVVTASGGGNVACHVTLDFDELQTKLGISSSCTVHFVEKVGEDNWHLVYGVPSGPRVGMSHQGAIRMAQYGYTYVDILKYYYPNASLYEADGTLIESYNDTSTSGVVSRIYGESLKEGSFYGYLNADMVALRSEASEFGQTVALLNVGELIISLDKDNGWYYIKDVRTGLFGYVQASAITAFTTFLSVNEDDTNFRTGPGTSYSVLDVVHTGEQLAVYGESGNWYETVIMRTGLRGYIYKNLCDIIPTLYPSADVATPRLRQAQRRRQRLRPRLRRLHGRLRR
ncbi:MAG: SpoIID/LytB domain-containing protein [Clostridia bacterium]|nr:SpoIID/LytB domain-containing protein [Clostridia bacterium]